MMARSSLAALTARMDDLTREMGIITARMDRLDRPRLSWLHDSPPPGETPYVPDVLAYHLRTMERIPVLYYGIFGALYVSAALAYFVNTSGLAVLPTPLRMTAAVIYLLVGVGNVSCIWLPRILYQIRMAIPTIAVAGIILILGCIQNIRLAHISSVIGTIVVWGAIIWGHVAWATSIQGRVNHHEFTKQLLDVAREREAEVPP